MTSAANDPDRLLKRLWLVNGFALLALLVFGVGVAAFALIGERLGNRDDAVVAPEAHGQSNDKRARAVRFDVPARVRGSDTRLVLVRNGADYAPESGSSYGLYSSRGGHSDGPIVNVIFMPPGGSGGRLLFDRPAYVADVSYPGERFGDRDSTQSWITYEAATEDSNGDGKLDDDDRRELFVSALDGQNFRRVLPEPWRFKEFESLGDGRSIAVTALEGPRPGQRDWDERRAAQRAFLYDVSSGELRPFAALDSLAAQAGRVLGASGRAGGAR